MHNYILTRKDKFIQWSNMKPISIQKITMCIDMTYGKTSNK